MSVFDDAMDDWIDGGCKGTIEDYVNDPTLALDDDDENKTRYVPPANKVRTSMGRRRDLLHKDQIEEFAAWAVADGFVREDTKGQYEVLRLRWKDVVNGLKMQPYIFFKRERGQHVTSQAEGTQLITRWLRTRNTTT